MRCVFVRPGGKHDWYQNPRTKILHPIPRHNEINDYLAKHIIKMLQDEKPKGDVDEKQKQAY